MNNMLIYPCWHLLFNMYICRHDVDSFASSQTKISKMKVLIFVALSFLLGTFLTEAQEPSLRFNSTTIPGRVIPYDGLEGCPPADQREAARSEVTANLIALLRSVSFNVSVNVSQYCGRGSWIRVVHINMTDNSQQCPGTFREYSGPVRTCGRRTRSGGSCDSATFSVKGARYNRVCGRVIAYQVGSPGAFYPGISEGQSIDSYYLDGISITHGSPRQHIWSFAASPDERSFVPTRICPCSHPHSLAMTTSVRLVILLVAA